VICQQIQELQRRRVQIYKEAEDLNPRSIKLKIDKSPSIYFDLDGNDIDQFLNER
jgi:predicted secreted acid phosphatase